MTITAKDQLMEYVQHMDHSECCLLVDLIDIQQEQSLEQAGNLIKILTPQNLAKAIAEYNKRERACSCGICKQTVPNVGTAIDEGWSPELWENENDPSELTPVCPECQEKYCTWEYGELTIRNPGQFVC